MNYVQLDNSKYSGKNFGLCPTPPDIWTEDYSPTLVTVENPEGEAGDIMPWDKKVTPQTVDPHC